MKRKFSALASGAVALVLAGSSLALTAGAASAANASWEPDTNAQGTITFYNAAGQIITGGLLSDSPPWKYAAASSAKSGSNANTKASMQWGIPDHNVADTNGWSQVAGRVASQTFPVASGPSSITGLASNIPVSTAGAGEANLSASAGSLNDSLWPNQLQAKLVVGTEYWQAVIEINTSGATRNGIPAGQWRVLGASTPTNASTTTSTPTASVASPQVNGTSVTFSTTVTGAASGTVKFFDGATQIGATKNVTSDGGTVTSDATTSLSIATHSITAQYIAPDFAAISGSTSSALSYVITKAPAAATTTTLSLGSASVQKPAAATATAVVTKNADSSVVTAGSVTFKSDGNVIGTDSSSPYTLSYSSSNLSDGTHSITAEFTPTDATDFVASTSGSSTLTVTAPAYTASDNNISTSIPAGTIVITTSYTGANTLALPAMTLNAEATEYSTSATFDGIQVADTRPGNLAYTLSALASDLTKTGSAGGVNEKISGQNVGLTGISKTSSNVTPNTFLGGVASGGATAGQNLTAFNNAAAAHVAATDAGSAGLGGGSPHAIVHANSGLGTSVFTGLLSIKAPTNTLNGTYTGTVTLTVVGS